MPPPVKLLDRPRRLLPPDPCPLLDAYGDAAAREPHLHAYRRLITNPHVALPLRKPARVAIDHKRARAPRLIRSADGRALRRLRLAMPLTLEQLEAIQADNMADDIDIDFEKMSAWTEAEAQAFFESGGALEPGAFLAPPNTPLTRKPRVVLLHGGYTNPKIFDFQLAKAKQRWAAVGRECS